MSKQRKSGPKVKTGCRTCKFRRIKCDEEKPYCRKCTSTGRQCDGYASPKEGLPFQLQVWSYGTKMTFNRTVAEHPIIGESMRYLEYYYHCARPMLSTSFDDDFWSRITLQMAHSESSIRHALIALGYLHRNEDGSLRHARSKFAAHHESKTLLYHYNKSVRSLIDRMADTTNLHEVSLVTCLLFVCIEYLRGNYHTAFTHMRNGFKLINTRDRMNSNSPRSHPRVIQAEAAKNPPSGASVNLGSSTSHDHLTSYPSPASSTASIISSNSMVEYEIRPLFIRAIASALMYGVEVDTVIDIPPAKLEYYQHLRFMHIREVQLSFHELRNESIIVIRNMSRSLFWYLDTTKEGPSITLDQLSEQANLLNCQQAWYIAMRTFENQPQLSKADRLALSALKAQYYTINIWTSCAADFHQTPFDAHMDGFRAIVYHARQLLDSMDFTSKQAAAKFTFEISLIPPLYFVGTRCRCPSTRREAIELLAGKPPREGLWDAEQHVIVTKRVVEIEEEEVDPKTGWPVERTRLWSSVIDANMDQNGGFWAYFAPARHLGELNPERKPKILHEFFVV